MHPFLSTLLSPSLVPYWLGTYAVLFLSWFLACAFFELCEQRQWLRAYAIQPSQSPPSWALKRRALEMAALNWAWLPFALFAAAPVLRLRFSAEAPFPPLPLFAVQLVACFLLDDCCFYAYHRVLHVNKKLYVRFHKPHHVFTAPFAWTSHAVHPVEMALQSVGAMLGPALFGFSLHALWAWYVVRQWQGVLDHTGLHLPIDPIGWLPGVGGTKFHDEHHQYFSANYASCFSFIDDLFGTRYVPRPAGVGGKGKGGGAGVGAGKQGKQAMRAGAAVGKEKRDGLESAAKTA